MRLWRMWLGAFLMAALACASQAPAPTAATRAEFRQLCKSLGMEGDKLSRDRFLAQAQDKETAARLFDACDRNRDGLVTEEEVQPDYLESLKSQVIRLTTPPPPTTRGLR